MRSDNMFINSTAVIVEYHDIIKSPWFTVLQVNRDNPHLAEDLDLTSIENLGDAELYEWYKTRHNINPFKDLNTTGKFSDIELDELMNAFINSNPAYVEQSHDLEMVRALNTLFKEKFTTTYYMYIPEKSPVIESDVHHLFPDIRFNFIYGDLIAGLKDADMDCTYILSDIKKVKLLADNRRIYCNSVMVASDYAYNHVNGLNSPFAVDFGQILSKYLFKGAYFTASKLPFEYSPNVIPK